MNKELLNICYKYFNSFINARELVDKLNDINTDRDKIEEIINKINEIIETTSDKEDEYIKNKKETIKHFIEKLEATSMFEDQIKNLKDDYNRKIDTHERWYKIVNYIDSNEYFDKCFKSLNDYELLEFVAQYIKAPFPPQFNEEEFNRLIKAGIEKDEREWLWRLAFNYDNSGFDFNPIVDYYIEKKDGYYLMELLCSIGFNLDIDSILNKIEDKELIKYLLDNKKVLENVITKEQFGLLEENINKN